MDSAAEKTDHACTGRAADLDPGMGCVEGDLNDPLPQIAFGFTDVGGILGLPSRTWQSLFDRGARGLRFSDNVLVTARKDS